MRATDPLSRLTCVGGAELLTSSIFTGMLLGGLVGGWLSDRYGRKPMLVCTLIINAAGGRGARTRRRVGMMRRSTQRGRQEEEEDEVLVFADALPVPTGLPVRAAGGLLSAASPSLAWLLFFRVIAGIGTTRTVDKKEGLSLRLPTADSRVQWWLAGCGWVQV